MPDLTQEEIDRRENELLDIGDPHVYGPVYYLSVALDDLVEAARLLTLITLYHDDLLYTDFAEPAPDIREQIDALADDAKKLLTRVHNMLPEPELDPTQQRKPEIVSFPRPSA